MDFNPNQADTVRQVDFRNRGTIIPSVFFKFRAFVDDRHLRILTHQELYLTPPILFNDPFDCRIATDYRDCKGPQLRRIMERSAPPGLSRAQKERLMQKAIRYKTHLDFENQIAIMEESLANVGVFSASANWDNILLWSHYGNNHSGFCVGIDSKEFSGDLELRYQQFPKTGLVFPYQVAYGSYPKLFPFSQTIGDRVRISLISKSPDWEYEKEIRFIGFELPRQRRQIHIRKQTIDTLLLGVSISREDKCKTLKIVEKELPHVKVWQAMRKKYAFGLDFVRI